MTRRCNEIIKGVLTPHATEWAEIQLLKKEMYEECASKIIQKLEKAIRMAQRAIFIAVLTSQLSFVFISFSRAQSHVEDWQQYDGYLFFSVMMMIPAMIMVPGLIRSRTDQSKVQTAILIYQMLENSDTSTAALAEHIAL